MFSCLPFSPIAIILFLSVSTMAQTASEDWKVEEAAWLKDPVQLTFNDRFVKAGEAYFSPDGSKVIFQAVEQPPPGSEPAEFYAMFVANTVRDESGRVQGLQDLREISPKGTANTCGWFHPMDPNIVLFATTMAAPQDTSPPGYQRGTARYRWMFPPEMRIVVGDLRTLDGTASTLETLAGDGSAYTAEGSFSPDGRYLLYTSLEEGQGDIYLKDLASGEVISLVSAPGYDGGPFFSPDGRRITYRSDRHNNNLLQVFVADLEIDDLGTITGVRNEHQVTDDEHVNWCPFWHPDGKHLLYASSRVGHRNYEVFMVDAAHDPEAVPSTSRYGTGLRRVTYAPGADVLPAFNSDGHEVIWTSKRGAEETSQLWAALFVGDLNPPSARVASPPEASRGAAERGEQDSEGKPGRSR
ncbi:MAG: hypothetical protein MK085_05775 [Phycisphaerales bacterium]|nr:hypothetical protein [Phycisphaerales bacterium]